MPDNISITFNQSHKMVDLFGGLVYDQSSQKLTLVMLIASLDRLKEMIHPQQKADKKLNLKMKMNSKYHKQMVNR
jgi:hypothetical protein